MTHAGISKLVPHKWRHVVEYTFGVYIYLILLILGAVSVVRPECFCLFPLNLRLYVHLMYA